jgi:RIO kinase 1
MGYVGSREQAAPTLSEVGLETREASALFRTVLQSIEAMLRQSIIHGDLSAYNILYWNGRATVIDFPQITSPETNTNARALLDRDMTRVCEYFSRQGGRLRRRQTSG